MKRSGFITASPTEFLIHRRGGRTLAAGRGSLPDALGEMSIQSLHLGDDTLTRALEAIAAGLRPAGHRRPAPNGGGETE